MNPNHGAVDWIQNRACIGPTAWWSYLNSKAWSSFIESKPRCYWDQNTVQFIESKPWSSLLNPNHGAFIESKTRCSLWNPKHGAGCWIQNTVQIESVAWWSYLNPKQGEAIESKPRCYWIQNTVLFNPKPGEAGLPLFPSLLVSRARHVESLHIGLLR